MAVDDAFGNPGGAGRIDDVESVFLGRIERRSLGSFGGHERVQLLVQHNLALGWQLKITQLGQLGPIDEQMLGA